MSSQPDLAAIRARAEAATKGPWARIPFGGQWKDDPEFLCIGRMNDASEPINPDIPCDAWEQIALGNCVTPENAAFIIHARTDVPALLDLVDLLRAQRDKAVKALEPFAEMKCGRKHRGQPCSCHFCNAGQIIARFQEAMP
jgi:hypothetical protein